MDPLKTNALPRDVISEFIKSPRGVRSYEDLQGDTTNVYEAISTASFLVLANEPTLGSERTLTLTADLTGVDSGANSPYTLGLSNTAVATGTYGSASKVVSFTVSAKGRLTAAAEYALNSDNMAEGAVHLFFTNTRARAALSGGTGISYNSGTGSIAVSTKLALYDGGNTPSAFTLGIIDSVDGAAWRTAIGAGTSSTTGTVTSVAALTLGTTGTDLSSSVANGTTTPVITLNVPTASASNRGVLSTADWSTFNGKQAALVSGTNIKTVGGVTLLGAGDVGVLGVTYGGTGVTTSTGSGANVQATQPQFTNTIGVGVAASASGSGVSFPATQSASTDPNTLDDYEEGTWTPTVVSEGGSITTYSASGYYTKIGRQVYATVLIDMTNYGTATGALIASLPFTAATGPSWVGAGRETALVGNMLQGIITSGSATIAIRSYNNATPGTSGCSLVVTVSYFV